MDARLPEPASRVDASLRVSLHTRVEMQLYEDFPSISQCPYLSDR